MRGRVFNLARGALCVVVLTALSVGLAHAAPATVASNTNLRQGPGTSFAIIMTVPGGSVVNVIRCGGEWCNVMANGQPGYMIARNLGMAGPRPVAVVAPPPVAVVAPPPVVVVPGPYFYGPRVYGPGIYYGPRRYWRRW